MNTYEIKKALKKLIPFPNKSYLFLNKSYAKYVELHFENFE